MFIPWEAIDSAAQASAFMEVGHGIRTRAPALGVRVGNVEKVVCLRSSAPPKPALRASWSQSRRETGYELTYLEEALILPSKQAEFLLRYFIENPRARRELSAGETSLGFLETLLHDARRE